MLWPLPSRSATTPPTVPLPSNLTFVSRFCDSTFVRFYQQTFRTARANMIKFAPERNRAYELLGSAVAAYSLDTFFHRLASREPLVPATSAPVNPPNQRTGPAEVYLKWDKFFYAENTGSGWKTPIVDGQDRLFDFDWDDRGYVYVATFWGWGIVHDDGANDGRLMPTLYQDLSGLDASRILSLRSGDRYFVAVPQNRTCAVWDVTDPSTPVRQQPDLPLNFFAYAKLSGNRIAFVTSSMHVVVYSVDALLSGGSPLFTSALNGYYDVTTDGTNLFAISMSPDALPIVSVFSGSNFARFTTTTIPGPAFTPGSLHYGGGYLALGGFGPSADVRILKLDANLVPVEVPLNGYLGQYYGATPPPYAKPDSTQGAVGVPFQQGANVYLVMPAEGLGDVYLLEGNAPPEPPVVKPPVPPVPPDPPAPPEPPVPPGPPPPKPGCPKMTTSNIVLSLVGADPLEPRAKAGDLLTFQISGFYGYQFTCAPHSFAWFVDGRAINAAGPDMAIKASFGTPGTHHVQCTVRNPTDALITSVAVQVDPDINPTNQTPIITGYSPASVRAGSGPFTLTVHGSNFKATSQIYVNGKPRGTSPAPDGLQCTLLSSDVAYPTQLVIGVGEMVGSDYVGARSSFPVYPNDPLPPGTLEQRVAALEAWRASVEKR